MFENTIFPKGITFTKEKRFKYMKDHSPAHSLVGPGTYNNHLNFQKQVKIPCQVKIRPMTGIKRNNASHYIMIGDQIIFQPQYLNNDKESSRVSLNFSKLNVDPNASIPYNYIANLKKNY